MPTTREEVEGRPPRIHEAASLEKAVELARRFKDEGTYDWFRGQVGDWVAHSSLYRRFVMEDRSEHDLAIRRRDWLWDWACKTPELSYATKSEKAYEFLAIAQHYGIPTNLIDFTTDPGVAGFFAADTTKPTVGGTSCIYCLDSRSIDKVWGHAQATRDRAGMRLEAVRIDVRNLWRLQAQCGVFIHANYAWEIDYPLDRILFPYSGYPVAPKKSEIYPTDKSALEILLDQHFGREIVLDAATAVGQFVKASGRDSQIHLITTNSSSNDRLFGGGTGPEYLRSWDAKTLVDWQADAVEDYHETVVGELRAIELGEQDREARRRLVRLDVERILRVEPNLRLKAVTWDVRGLPAFAARGSLPNALRLMWNGMRRLPYTCEEIAECAASVVVLMADGFCDGAREAEQRRIFERVFGEPFLAMLAIDDGSYSFGHVSRAALLAGLRPEMSGLLSESFSGDFEKLFSFVANPKLMFKFSFVRELFVRELIPSQVAIERPSPIFNPAKLTTLGNP